MIQVRILAWPFLPLFKAYVSGRGGTVVSVTAM